MIGLTGRNGQGRVCGSQESRREKEHETNGVKSIGAGFGMETMLRWKYLLSGSSFVCTLLPLKMSKKHCACMEGCTRRYLTGVSGKSSPEGETGRSEHN